MVVCKNCGQNCSGSFCNNCGQKTTVNQIDFKFIISEIRYGLLQFDKGFFYTIKELFTRPGQTIREYIEGQRVYHFKPIVFVIILSTIYGVLAHFLNLETMLNSLLTGITEGWNHANEKNEDMIDSLRWLINNYQYSSILLLPFISLVSYITFFKTGYNYFEHFIFQTFLTGQRTIVSILILLIELLFSDSYFLGGLSMLLLLILTFWSFKQFFDQLSIGSVIFRSLLFVVLLFTLLTIILIFMFAILRN